LALALAGELEDRAVMVEPIDNGRGRHRIGKDVRPIVLREVGPTLGRPYAYTLNGSEYRNMKEPARSPTVASAPAKSLKPTRCMPSTWRSWRKNNMARPYDELRNKYLSAEAQARSDAKAKVMLSHYRRLSELRRARAQSQATVAELMGLKQPTVAELEQRTDAYVSTIRRHLDAIGAKLRIIAEFEDGETYEISQFGEIAEETVAAQELRHA
jgi:DNA-binding XRE family transcriptional regulator